MGVYVFESKYAELIKVGHFAKNNAWRRIAPKRGFYSTRHPKQLEGKLSPLDFDLRFWFPSLGTRDEARFHKDLEEYRVIGEWYDSYSLRFISKLTNEENLAHICSFEDAMAHGQSRSDHYFDQYIAHLNNKSY